MARLVAEFSVWQII